MQATSSKNSTISVFSDLLSGQAGRETTRAFIIFGLLLLAVVAIAVQLTFRELSLKVLQERLDLGSHEAEVIADTVRAVAQDGDRIDFSRVQANKPALTHLIQLRIAESPFIHKVEVRDRFGGPQLVVTDRAMFDFDNAQCEMQLVSLHPGITLDDVRAEIGWELQLADTIGETPAPTEDELHLIRVRLDPQGMYR